MRKNRRLLRQGFVVSFTATLLFIACGGTGDSDKGGKDSGGKGGSSSGTTSVEAGAAGMGGVAAATSGGTSSSKGGKSSSGGKGGTTSTSAGNGGGGQAGETQTGGGGQGQGQTGGNAGVAGVGAAAGASAAGGVAGAGGAGSLGPCQGNEDCDNKTYCDGEEQCIGVGEIGADARGCIAGTAVTCADDGFTCTIEVCNVVKDKCESVTQDESCLDDKYCNGAERCAPSALGHDVTTGCVIAPDNSRPCSDGVACTEDTCDEGAKACKFTPKDSNCDNGDFCDGEETCDPTTVTLNDKTGCVAGTPPDCEDGIGCTTHECDPVNGCVLTVKDDASCDQGTTCVVCQGGGPCPDAGKIYGGAECDEILGCVDLDPISCTDPDGKACTVTSCVEAAHGCSTTFDHSQCPAGEFCTGNTADGCEPNNEDCDADADCDDGLFCNGAETCVASKCKAGTLNCKDAINCTTDSCDEVGNKCVHTAVNALCDDGNVCNGVETCDKNTGCTNPADLNCASDGKSCTDESCNAISGCLSTPINSRCDDDTFCNGAETCSPGSNGANPTTGCLAGTNVVCNDGVTCTLDTCNNTLDQCVYTPDDTLCQSNCTNGVCTCAAGGTPKVCDVGSGSCLTPTCTKQKCINKQTACGDCIDNDGDCKTDGKDELCIGVCIDSETIYTGPPASNSGNCNLDCYFDVDNGSGNDGCYWNHQCDPLAPQGTDCTYNANVNLSGTSDSCEDLDGDGTNGSHSHDDQTNTCINYCAHLTPNGCDCFGCCYFSQVVAAPHTVYLGTNGGTTCTLADVNNTAKCKMCTQVGNGLDGVGCLNTCEHCELCVGKTTLPDDCTEQVCPNGVQKCGLTGQAACPSNQYCVTGCCQALPT